MIPSIPCRIEFYCPIHPSEDPNKVVQAVSNVFPNSKISTEEFSVLAVSESLTSLEKVIESVRSKRSERTYRRHLQRNLVGTSSWIYLNKQAAFIKKAIICDEADESPLGPIKITLVSAQIDKIIDWIACDEGDRSRKFK